MLLMLSHPQSFARSYPRSYPRELPARAATRALAFFARRTSPEADKGKHTGEPCVAPMHLHRALVWRAPRSDAFLSL